MDTSKMKEHIQVGDRMIINDVEYIIKKILLPTLPDNQDITVFV